VADDTPDSTRRAGGGPRAGAAGARARQLFRL